MAAREPGANAQARRAALLDTLGCAGDGEDSGQSDTVEFAVEALVALKQDRSCSVSVGSVGAVTSRRHSSCAPLDTLVVMPLLEPLDLDHPASSWTDHHQTCF